MNKNRIKERSKYQDDASILVSICCIAYNHQDYIRECLDSILKQKLKQKIEIIVHDDASTDNTTNIIKDYQKRFPEIIKPIFQRENQYSRGHRILPKFAIPAAKGKYVAICECDDLWTDEYKLEKCITYLEANPNLSAVAHDAIIRRVDHKDRYWYSSKVPLKTLLRISYIRMALKGGGAVPTASLVFKKASFDAIPLKVWDAAKIGDYWLTIYFCANGLVCLPFVGAIIRKNHEGSWSKNRAKQKKFKVALKEMREHEKSISVVILQTPYVSIHHTSSLLLRLLLMYGKNRLRLAKVILSNFVDIFKSK